MVFALGATGLLGLVGLAVEGGTWYLEKRNGQNAADAAASSGALALASGSSGPAAVASATSIATANGYSSGTSNGTGTTVTINYGTYSAGTFSANTGAPNAVQAVVTRTPPLMFSGLFLASNPVISEAALATVNANGGNACVLGLAGGLSFAGSTQINVSNCALASNATGSNSISFSGNKATVSGGTLVAAGGCSNCGNSLGYLMYQPPTTDPYVSIQSLAMPSFNSAHCLAIPTVGSSTTLTPWVSSGANSQMAYCGSSGSGQNSTLSTSAGNVLHFVPGTYFFQDASISFTGGTVDCTGCTPGGAGVTIILVGTAANKVGSIGIGGNASVTLNAPATNSYNAAFNGVLFYMDKSAQPTNGNGNAPVSLTGNGSVHLTGGMYFPSVNVNYSGDVSSSNAATACTEIVGWQLNVTGNSTLNVAGCAADGTSVAQTKSLQLVQ